jgi:hypothetical protein
VVALRVIVAGIPGMPGGTGGFPHPWDLFKNTPKPWDIVKGFKPEDIFKQFPFGGQQHAGIPQPQLPSHLPFPDPRHLPL